MSVAELKMIRGEIDEHHRRIDELIEKCAQTPIAWAIISNPVYSRAEVTVVVALFDTQEAAEDYYEKSKLDVVTPVEQVDRTIYRTFRPDSVLWDYNARPLLLSRSGTCPVVPASPAWDLSSVPINPDPPAGPCPPLTELDKPQYGKDYARGQGSGL